MKYWLNIDYPSKFATLHLESCCSCRPDQQKYKGINKLGKNGGWFSFGSLNEAHEYYNTHYQGYRWHECKRCKVKYGTKPRSV